MTLQQAVGVPTNRISSVTNGGQTVSYGYDSAGNVTSDGVHSYQYDAENRLVKVDAGTGNESSYWYDAKNRRVKKLSGGYTTYYIWEGSRVITEYSTAPPIGVGGFKYYHPDRLSTRMITDVNGNVIGTQDHLPFGEDAGTSGEAEKHRFTSYERDGESGLDYAVNRQYGLGVGRFMRTDPKAPSLRSPLVLGSYGDPQSLNRYSYTRNDPVNLNDPLGLEAAGFLVLWPGCIAIKQVFEYYSYWQLFGSTCDSDGRKDLRDGGDTRGGGGAGTKDPLTGKKLKRYNEERAKTQNKLRNSQKCRDFLSTHGIDPDQALDAVNQQRAYDGTTSTIAAYIAGIYNHDDIDWSNPAVVRAAYAPIRNLFHDPNRDVGAITGTYPGGLPPSQTTVGDRSDVYYSGSGISASSILHEGLHSLTGASDEQLAQQLGVTLGPGGSSQPISDALHNNDCGG